MDKEQLKLRRQVGELFDLIEGTRKLAETTARAQDTRRTALMPGEAMQIMDADGNVAAYFGGSNSSGQLIEHVNGPEPKRPSAPELDSPMPGVITVVADGRDEDGEEAQGNHDRVLIHLSHEEGFTPTEATAQHSFFGPEGRQDVSVEPGEWYVAIQWKTKTGQLSESSEQVMVEVLELVNSADIKATLEESRQRLADAMEDFEEGNETRKQEIENLNDVVLPALEQSLTDAMTELEGRVGDVDLSHLETALAELNETRLPAIEDTLADKAESSDLPALETRLTTAFGEDLNAASEAAAKDATAKADAAREAAKSYADSELAVEAARITAAQEDAVEAMSAAEAAQATADGAIRTYYQPEPPTLSDEPKLGLGDLWYDTDNDQASRWDGAKWKVIQDSTIAQALGKAEAAQATADGKITAYYQDTTPSQGQVGDLWYDTGDDNKPHYCTSATPLEWVPVRDGEIANAELRAAQDALDKANAAEEAAEQAAKDHADNLPKVLHGTTAPSGTAPDGSIWWQHQGSLQGAVTAQWNRVDGSWVSTPIDSEAIANLDVGKLTAGGAVISDAVIQDLTAANGAFDRLDAREGWIGDVALEDGAVTARTVDVEELFTNEAVINTLWADRIQARVAELARAVIAAPNLWPDPNFEQDVYGSWSLVEGGIERDGTDRLSVSYVRSDGFSIPIERGAQYRIAADLTLDGPGRAEIWTRDVDADQGYVSGSARSHNMTESGRFEVIYESNYDNAEYFYIGFGSRDTDPSTRLRLENLKVERMTDGSLVVENSISTRQLAAEAVKAANIDVEELFADEAVVNTVWAEVVRAGLLTAEEALIGGALIQEGVIDAGKINAESVTAAVAQFLEIEAGMIKANAFEGTTFTGGIFQGSRFETHADPNRGVKMMPGGLVGYNPEGGTSFELNAATGGAVMRSEGGGTHTELSGHGIEISGGWEPYPDPQLSDPFLNEARSWTMDGWANWRMTNAGGVNIFPDLHLFDIVFIVTVHSEGEVDVRGLSREVPENGSASYAATWDFNEGPAEYQLRMEGGGSIRQDRPYFAWIGLYGDVSMKSMWLEPKDGTETQVRLSVASDGIRTWDESGVETARFGGGGQNFLAGRLFTNSPGQPGIILDHDRGPDYSQGPGIWFSENGTLDSAQPAIWIRKDAKNYYTEMIIRGRRFSDGSRASTTVDGGLNVSGGGIEAPGERISGNQLVADDYLWARDRLIVEGGGAFHAEATFGGKSYFNEHAKFHGWVQNPGRPTRTSGANVYMGGSSEYLWKNTSVRRAKVNIETAPEIHHRLLDLEPRIWIDRSDVEMESDECANLIQDTPEGPVVDEERLASLMADGKLPRRVPGLVAEEVEAAGLEEFAVYETDEETGEEKLQSVAYDRIWTLLIPLVREHRDRIEALEAENEALNSKVNDLEARLTALEAKIDD